MRMLGNKGKNGLVLEGGALRGLFSAGVIDVWMENGIVFDGLVGVSAGACFGCNYKSRQIGRVIRYNRRFAKDPRYCSWSSLFRTGDMFGADFCYDELPERLDLFDKEEFERNPMEFHLSVTDVHTGHPVYRKLDAVNKETYAWIRASASMPLVARPVAVGGGLYLDGGLSDGIPIKYFESLGYSRNVVVTTRPRGYRKLASWKHKLLRPFLWKYPAVCKALETRHVWYNRTLEYIDRRVAEGAALLIAPETPLPIPRVCHDPDQMQRVYDIGRAAGEKSLESVRNFLGQNR